MIIFISGFNTFGMLMLMYTKFLDYGAHKLNYWDGPKKSMGEKGYISENKKKPGPPRKMRVVDEFLLVLMWMKLGLLQRHLGDIFKVSTSTVSRVINTWINFMYDNCQGMVFHPSPEQLKFNIPRAFVDYPTCQMILDCTEFFIEVPSALLAQWQCWSEYKHHSTFKVTKNFI